MRHRIIVLRPVNTLTSGGGFITTWQRVHSVWCAIKPIKSARELQDNQIQLNDAMKFTTRILAPAPDKTMLIRYEGYDYTINSVVEVDERERFLEIIGITNRQPQVIYTT